MSKTIKQEENSNLKKAAIENIFIWIVLFATFVSILFFIINYTSIIRTKDTMDALADYGANFVATRGTGDDLSNKMNSIATKNFNNISANTNMICNAPVADNGYQIIFNVRTTNNSYYFFNKALSSQRVVFNQLGSSSITCNLNVTVNE